MQAAANLAAFFKAVEANKVRDAWIALGNEAELQAAWDAVHPSPAKPGNAPIPVHILYANAGTSLNGSPTTSRDIYAQAGEDRLAAQAIKAIECTVAAIGYGMTAFSIGEGLALTEYGVLTSNPWLSAAGVVYAGASYSQLGPSVKEVQRRC